MTDQTVTTILNELLGGYWTGMAQHQTHVALIESWGVAGLAASMKARIADEPVTIEELTNRLLDIGGAPAFEFGSVNIGTDLRRALDNDMAVQRNVSEILNAAAEAVGAAQDATTRILIEGILADEEAHLAWLELEIALLDKLGEPLYLASRLTGPNAASPVAGA